MLKEKSDGEGHIRTIATVLLRKKRRNVCGRRKMRRTQIGVKGEENGKEVGKGPRILKICDEREWKKLQWEKEDLEFCEAIVLSEKRQWCARNKNDEKSVCV
uniref:Uncharacterized protein n=1 Tax=Pseudictyota dubia TaxID=2749911 RepID=A0A7R9VTY7_9STRA|mmetsp:Transcript_2364/g.4119  ORF Transcript_2364/g.4119 Transcript_2364/m.4119 type:complete len:102 (+) Transcript_2364:158-463(+)